MIDHTYLDQKVQAFCFDAVILSLSCMLLIMEYHAGNIMSQHAHMPMLSSDTFSYTLISNLAKVPCLYYTHNGMVHLLQQLQNRNIFNNLSNCYVELN